MKMWVADHTLCFDFKRVCYLFRPCNSLDGKLSINGIDIPWFRKKVLESKSGRSIWTLYSVPYFCVGFVKLGGGR